MSRCFGAVRVLVYIASLSIGSVACTSSTAYSIVDFYAEAAGVSRDATAPLLTTTPLGWQVTINEAYQAMGPLYFRNAAPNGGTNQDEGRVVAQVLAQFTVDALKPAPIEIQTMASGATEQALSAEVRWFDATTGPIADAVGKAQAVAYFSGIAQRDFDIIPFRGALELPDPIGEDAYRAFQARRVVRIAANFTPDDTGRLIVRVDPTHWFDSIAFEAVPKTSDNVANLSDPSQVTSLRDNMGASQGVYSFEWINNVQ